MLFGIRWSCDVGVYSSLIFDKDSHFFYYASLVLLSAKSTAKASRLNCRLNGLTALLAPTKLKLAAHYFFQRKPIDYRPLVFQAIIEYWLKHQFRFTAQKHRSPYQQLRPDIKFFLVAFFDYSICYFQAFLRGLFRFFPAPPFFRPSSSVGNGGLCDRWRQAVV